MIAIEKRIFNMSRSRTLILPKFLCDHLGVSYGDTVQITVEGDHLAISAVKKKESEQNSDVR